MKRKSLATDKKEYVEVQALMDQIVKLNEKQLHLLAWRIHEFFRERSFVPVFLNMLEQNPPELRKAAKKIIRAMKKLDHSENLTRD